MSLTKDPSTSTYAYTFVSLDTGSTIGKFIGKTNKIRPTRPSKTSLYALYDQAASAICMYSCIDTAIQVVMSFLPMTMKSKRTLVPWYSELVYYVHV